MLKFVKKIIFLSCILVYNAVFCISAEDLSNFLSKQGNVSQISGLKDKASIDNFISRLNLADGPKAFIRWALIYLNNPQDNPELEFQIICSMLVRAHTLEYSGILFFQSLTYNGPETFGLLLRDFTSFYKIHQISEGLVDTFAQKAKLNVELMLKNSQLKASRQIYTHAALFELMREVLISLRRLGKTAFIRFLYWGFMDELFPQFKVMHENFSLNCWMAVITRAVFREIEGNEPFAPPTPPRARPVSRIQQESGAPLSDVTNSPTAGSAAAEQDQKPAAVSRCLFGSGGELVAASLIDRQV